MVTGILHTLSTKFDSIIADLSSYIEENKRLIVLLAFVIVAAYGFELFNFNLTIDEEVAARQTAANIAWISQGRWGMYFLEKFLLPQNVIPFIPLFLALMFHLIAVLMLMSSLGIIGNVERFIVGSIYLTFPGMAFINTFSTLNYGVGFGLFCNSLSLFLYTKNNGLRRFWAIIPAAFAVSIYQGLIPALGSLYLLYFIFNWGQTNYSKLKRLIEISMIILLAVLVYYLIQKLLLIFWKMPNIVYVEQFFDIKYLRDYFRIVIGKLFSFSSNVYTGDKSLYGIDVTILKSFLIVSAFGICMDVLLSKEKIINKAFLLILSFGLMITPFLSGLLTRGLLAMRFLVGLPTVISGWVMLGLKFNSRAYRAIVVFLAIYCIFQFVTSINHLFASSSLALLEDRLLGGQLIERIEDSKAISNSKDVKYMEMIGYVERPATELIPKSETFGVSFFEWDQGNVSRVLLFLQTLGYQGLQQLPQENRAQYIKIADMMPAWPDPRSVKVIDNVVLVKFGDYSETQKLFICKSIPDDPFCK